LKKLLAIESAGISTFNGEISCHQLFFILSVSSSYSKMLQVTIVNDPMFTFNDAI